ncbi:hypothetical protein HZS_5230 [Henneguya salminicola]|nr:hypothetical protein HZS_5230 [Henneguya salminicola]
MSAAIEALKKVSNAKIPNYIKLSRTKSFILPLPKLDHVYRLKGINKELLEKFDSQIREKLSSFLHAEKVVLDYDNSESMASSVTFGDSFCV